MSVVTAPLAGAGTNGPTTYEVDCVGSGLAAGQTAPFVEGLNANTNVADPQPAGTSFGVSGTATETLIGPIVAGAEQVVNLSTFGLGAILNETVGTTDGSATGSFVYNHTFPNQPVSGRQVLGVSYTAGTPTLTGAAGTFLASDVGTATNPMFVAGPSAGVPATPTIDPNSTVVSVAADGSSATISLNTLQTQAGVTIGLGQTNTFVDPTFSTGNVFTSSGAARSNIGVTSMTSITLIVVPNVIQATFGGSPGVGPTGCLLTGYDAVGNPGPSQTGDTTPADPVITHPQYVAAGITPLVLASGGFITQPGTAQMITPPAAAFVAGDLAPVASDTTATIDRNVSNTTMLTLPATDTDATPVASCSQVGAASDPRLTVSISNSPTPCVATLTDTNGASTGATVTFQFNASDTAVPPKVSNTATVTVTIVPIPHVAVSTASPLPGGTLGQPYGPVTLQATGGTPPYTWTATGLPAGLSVDSTGVISGTPTVGGDFTVVPTVTDADSPAETAMASLALHIITPCDDALNVIVGGVRSAASTTRLVGKVTNTGTEPCTVSDTSISWTIMVGGSPTTGSVTALNPGTFTLGPGASKRFRFSWSHGTDTLVPGVTQVVFTGTIPPDATPADNTDTETRTAK